METQQVHMKGFLSWLVRWARCASPRDFCPALAAVVGSVKNLFFRTVHFFTSFVHIAQQAGQAAVPRCLSLKMCLWWWPKY